MGLFAKIKEKGLVGCAVSIRYRIIKKYNNFLIKMYSDLPIDEHSIVLESEGDCCDNAYALYDYMKQNGYVGKYKITWLVEHPENFRDEKSVKYVKKSIDYNFAINTIKALSTCKWYIYDHCNVMSDYEKKQGQTFVYLSHGCGYKASKGSSLTKCKSRYDYTMSTGPMSAEKLSRYWGMPLEYSIITGYPRLDYLFQKNDDVDKKVDDKWNFNLYKKIFFWMPTFRQSSSKYLSEDYIQNETGLPIFETNESLKEFDEFLASINSLVVFKIHHLQAELPVFSIKFQNIIIIKDEDLQAMDIQLYQIIHRADTMISDYSSISIDYLIVNRPIIYTLDDYEQYDKSRGFDPPNAIDFMPGHHVYNSQELKNSIKEIVQGIDRFSNERKKIINLYHKYQDGDSSLRILNFLNINL